MFRSRELEILAKEVETILLFLLVFDERVEFKAGFGRGAPSKTF